MKRIPLLVLIGLLTPGCQDSRPFPVTQALWHNDLTFAKETKVGVQYDPQDIAGSWVKIEELQRANPGLRLVIDSNGKPLYFVVTQEQSLVLPTACKLLLTPVTVAGDGALISIYVVLSGAAASH